MNQRDLNREVAQATGESIKTIDRMGFSPLRVRFEQDPEEYAVDWDKLEVQRRADLPSPTSRRSVVVG